MARKPTQDYDVFVTPIQTGYSLSVPGLRRLVVADGYEGSLDQVVRGLIATEVGQSAESITVRLRYAMMDEYRRSSRPSWGILVLGLLTLVVAAMSLILLNPFLARIASFGLFVLVVVRLVQLGKAHRRVE